MQLNYSWHQYKNKLYSSSKDSEDVQERDVCFNSSDCVGNSLQFCNHDAAFYGFCEPCQDLTVGCVGADFLCERGEISCNETCGSKNDFGIK